MSLLNNKNFRYSAAITLQYFINAVYIRNNQMMTPLCSISFLTLQSF